MNIIKYVRLISVAIFALSLPIIASAADIESLLNNGKIAIEDGKYEEAVSYLGELMTASGDKTNDSKIVAFGSTVQAYGIWKMNNPQMTPMIIQYLNKAISADPTWKYPEKLLKEVQK